MTAGAFAEWQPRYAACGIATFPVRGKTPAVRGYLRIGAAASSRLAAKYGDADAFGLALEPAKLCIVDVDTPDERVLADAIDRFGPTPFVVRSGSGHFQAWYQRRNEGRRIRPEPDVPVDILGKGYVVAPPSAGSRGSYRIIEGTLADLMALPVMRTTSTAMAERGAVVATGARNDTLWRRCMEEAHACDSFEALLDVAETHNAAFQPPLPETEAVKTARSAWGYTVRGENWLGRGRRVVSTHAEVDGLLREHPDAYLLLVLLRRHHWGRNFVVANTMADEMPGGGWTRKRLAAARTRLEEAGLIAVVRPASYRHGPAVYRFKGGQF